MRYFWFYLSRFLRYTRLCLFLTIKSGNVLLRFFPSSLSTTLWLSPDYSKIDVQSINENLKKNDTFVDVGANIGYYTKIASSLCGPKGKVLSFEPLPRAYHLLKTNTRKLENTIIHQCALSDSIGNEKFYIKNRRRS